MSGFDDFLDSSTAQLESAAATRAAKWPAIPFDPAAAWVGHAARGAADSAAASASAPVGLSLPSTGFHSTELLRRARRPPRHAGRLLWIVEERARVHLAATRNDPRHR